MRINRHTHLKSSTLLSIKNRRKKKGEKESTFKFKYTKKHCRRSLSFNQLSIHHINPKIGAETKFHKIIPLKFQKKKNRKKSKRRGDLTSRERSFAWSHRKEQIGRLQRGEEGKSSPLLWNFGTLSSLTLSLSSHSVGD